MKLYYAKITGKGVDIHNIGACAIDKIHAANLINGRIKEYGYQPHEYNFTMVKGVEDCDWELGSTLIYN